MSYNTAKKNLQYLHLFYLNPLCLIYTIIRTIFRSILKQKRFFKTYRNIYDKFLLWPGIPFSSNINLVRLPDGKVCFTPYDDSIIFGEIWLEKVYTKINFPKEGDVVFDVGAHVGFFTIKASQLSGKKGQIISIEPNPYNYHLLNHNIEINNLSNVQSLLLALGNKNTKAKLYIMNRAAQSTLIPSKNKKKGFINVEIKKLDDLKKELGLNKIDFIKVDAEGYELQILEGAKKTLQECHPTLAIASYHYKKEVELIKNYLRKIGYQISIINTFVYAC